MIKKTQITAENACDYASRYMDLCESDTISKKQTKEVENKLKAYFKEIGIKIDVNPQNYLRIARTINDYDRELTIKNQLNSNEPIQITNENKNDLFFLYRYLEDADYDGSSLLLTKEEVQQSLNLYKETFVNYISENREFLDFSGEITVENIDKQNVFGFIDNIQKTQKKIKEIDKRSVPVINTINNPYDNKKLENFVNNYISSNNIKELSDIPEDVDIGNGKFDKTPKQMTNNCWAHSDLNSLLSVPKGRQLVESNYYRDESTGVIAVHLQEAEDFGFHDGIFVVTPQEIVEARENISVGEGDVTAYMIAIKKYFEEAKAKPEINDKRFFIDYDKGNTGFRFFEIMTGAQHYEYKSSDNLSIRNGIGTSTHFDKEQLYNLIENKQGAAVISLRGTEHAVSIVGAKDGKYFVQESNNNENYFDCLIDKESKERLFLPTDSINGKPTFILDKETLDKYNLGVVSFIKWE